MSPLLAEPRHIRVKAMDILPVFLDHLKVEAEMMLKSIERAEDIAEKL